MAASIVVPGQAFPCTVTEISPAGAKLYAPGDWSLPHGFWLRLEGDSHMHYCILAWSKERMLGVEFRPDHRGSWWRQGRSALQLPDRARI